MSKKWFVTVLDWLISKILMLTGFIFAMPVSFDPSVPTLYGCVLQCSTIYLWHSGARASFRIAEVLVLPQEYDDAIVLSGNISLKRGQRWSAVAIGKLC